MACDGQVPWLYGDVDLLRRCSRVHQRAAEAAPSLGFSSAASPQATNPSALQACEGDGSLRPSILGIIVSDDLTRDRSPVRRRATYVRSPLERHNFPVQRCTPLLQGGKALRTMNVAIGAMATSVSVVMRGRSSATNSARHTSFGASSPHLGSREPTQIGTDLRGLHAPQHVAC
jgi:hypothetical protein